MKSSCWSLFVQMHVSSYINFNCDIKYEHVIDIVDVEDGDTPTDSYRGADGRPEAY